VRLEEDSLVKNNFITNLHFAANAVALCRLSDAYARISYIFPMHICCLPRHLSFKYLITNKATRAILHRNVHRTVILHHITSLATAPLIRSTGAPQYTTNIRSTPKQKHAVIKRKCDKKQNR